MLSPRKCSSSLLGINREFCAIASLLRGWGVMETPVSWAQEICSAFRSPRVIGAITCLLEFGEKRKRKKMSVFRDPLLQHLRLTPSKWMAAARVHSPLGQPCKPRWCFFSEARAGFSPHRSPILYPGPEGKVPFLFSVMGKNNVPLTP